MTQQLTAFEFPLVWEIVVVAVVLHLGAFVRAPLSFVQPGARSPRRAR